MSCPKELTLIPCGLGLLSLRITGRAAQASDLHFRPIDGFLRCMARWEY